MIAPRPDRSRRPSRVRAPLGAVALTSVALLAAAPAAGQPPTELFFSEYVEGSSFNKAVEIYNGTGSAIDLGAAGYDVQIYFNGSASAGQTIALSGTVASGDVFVVANSSASAAVLAEADQTTGSLSFNGDDAVVLRKAATAIDVLGRIGEDPGSEWSGGGIGTQNETLRRKASICAGDPDGSDAFDPSVEWDGFAQDTFDGLGAHAVTCGGPTVPALLLTELVVTPTAGEYVEVFNPTGAAIDLSDVYLTDATFAGGGTYYYNIVTGSNAGGGGFADFHARFPDGATISAGEFQTVSLAGSDDFFGAYGVDPTYELYEDGLSADAIPDMREALPGSINGQGGLTNSGEVVVLYTWDGASDLVQDIDYALWGDKAEAVDKTGVSIDGPDAGTDTSTYLPETAIGSQDVIDTGGHAFGSSFQRIDDTEGAESQSGGNGVAGSDETSEDLSNTWSTDQAPTPGGPAPPPDLPALVINEILQNPSAVFDSDGEWFELFNADSTAVDIDGWTIADLGTNSHVINNGGPLVVPAGGYLVLARNANFATNGGVAADYQYSGIFLGNGSDELVLRDTSGNEVDRVEWDNGATFPDPNGASMSLIDPSLDNNVGGNWCTASTPFGAGDRGTPGAANDCGALPLVVNEIDYDQPGIDNAEFVEILNVGSSPVDLTGVELVLVNGTGGGAAVYNTIALPAVSLAAGNYFVVCGNAANVANCDLDVSPSSNLIQNGAPDAVALVFGGAAIIDTVSYEGNTGAPYTEGTGTSAADSNSSSQAFKGLSRFPDGIDTDDNDADFVFVCITPGSDNTSIATGCSATAPVLEIYDIQSAGSASPFVGQTVRTEDNAVTAVAPDGYFIQTPTARTDADADTSDGIFVFTGGAPGVAVGDEVSTTGVVNEFFGFTELTFAVTDTTGGLPLPDPIQFDGFTPSPDPTAPSCAIEFECYEGMLIEIEDGTVTGPNQRFSPDPIAEVHVTAAAERTFREPGIEFPGIFGFPIWDGNPEVFELDPDKLGLPNQVIPAGSSFSALGVLGFEFGGYELWPRELSFDPAPLPVPVRARQPGEFTVATLNLFRLFDDVNDPPSVNFQGETRNDSVVSSAEYARRLLKFAAYILEVLDAPDVLAVQEAEKLEVLEDLAAEIALIDPGVAYTAYLEEGNDVGTIDIGFLLRDTVAVDAVTQLGLTETFVDPSDGSVDILHDRPPLLLEGRCLAEFGDFPIQVLAVHQRSLGGIDGSDGVRVRQKRFEQANFVAAEVQAIQEADPEARVIVIGDFNAFEFTDGYVDAVGQIVGDFTPDDNLICDTNLCEDLVDPDLSNQVLGLDAGDRYSFIFRGSAQVLDHALTTQGLDPFANGAEYGRGNADAAFDLINDLAPPEVVPLRSSDHDGLVLFVQKDADDDGVPDDQDVCLGTAIPEGVPTRGLGVNRFALTDGDRVFDTVEPKGKGPGKSFDLGATGGCSCEQIIAALGLGDGHTKFGCSISAMEDWVGLVNP